jgi:hypothetical protein
MPPATTAGEYLRSARRVSALWYLGGLGLSALICAALLILGPTPAAVAWVIFLAALVVMLVSPRHGLYVLVALAMASDGRLAPWYPFMKNLSSTESLLYLHDAAIFNPIELFVAVIAVSWLARAILTRSFTLVTGPLFWPLLAFIGFITAGFVYGLGRGGDVTIALWAGRAIFYLPALLILTSNLVVTREHVRAMIWAALIGMAFKAVQGAWFVQFVLEWKLRTVNEIAEHSYSIHMNMAFVLLLMLVYYRGSRRMFWFLALAAPFMLVAVIGNQRRAGYVAIVVALIIFALLLHWQNRRLLWTLAPPLALIFCVYVVVFWNSTSPLAAGARQVRSIVAPVEGSEEQASNVYRELEDTNILYTIRQTPLTGVGFGQKFMIIAPMPDISFFAWWEYITHNSIVWIWMQAGAGGFLSMIFLIGSGVALSMRRMFETPPGELRALAFALAAFPIMHFVYAYVDMSWDGQSLILLGVCWGIINVFDRILARPVSTPPRRWPWQRQPAPPPGLQPL